jgi:hypothetical protein
VWWAAGTVGGEDVGADATAATLWCAVMIIVPVSTAAV